MRTCYAAVTAALLASVFSACTGGGGDPTLFATPDAGPNPTPSPNPTSDPRPTPGPADAGPDVTRGFPIPRDRDAGPEAVCGVTQRLDHTSVAYKSPRITAGACTSQAITDIETFIGNQPSVLFADLKAELLRTAGAGCASCVFASEAGGWAPVVEDAAGKVIDVNLGGCIEIVSGSAACGKAYQQFDTCTTFGCQACTTSSESAECEQAIVRPGGACEAAGDALIAACTDRITTYVEQCFPAGDLLIAGPIRKQCIGG